MRREESGSLVRTPHFELNKVALTMTSDWSYSTTCAIDESNTPMLVLDARTDVPLAFGNNTIFATSQLDLCLAVSADGLSVQSVALATSAFIRETVDWVRKVRL